jgi:hypothetical protein
MRMEVQDDVENHTNRKVRADSFSGKEERAKRENKNKPT